MQETEEGQRDTERDTNRDSDKGTVRVTGKKDRGTGTGTEGQGQWERRTGRGTQK